MKSCGSILIAGAVVMGLGIFATGQAENSSGFLTALFVMAVVGIIVARASKPGRPGTATKGSTAALQQRGQRAPGDAPGWTRTERSDALAREWNGNHPALPSTGIWHVRTGRAHRRQVTVFQNARFPPAATFMIFRLPDYTGPTFDATSDGRSEISVRGQLPEGLSEMLTTLGPRNFRRLGMAPGKLFWLDAGSMGEEQVSGFVLSQVPTIVQTVNQHLGTSPAGSATTGQPRAQMGPQAQKRPPAQKRPQAQKQPQAQQRPSAAAAPPVQQVRAPQRPAPLRPAQQRPAPLPHDLGPDPDEILQTAPIELQERPALRPAKADPVSESLAHPQLTTSDWKPLEWEASQFGLTAPMGLGETPSAVTELASGWKPKEWVPPTYGASSSSEWKPAEAWTPNYHKTSDDE